MKTLRKARLLLPLALLAGCASLPSGPRVAVMPAPGKPFEVFATIGKSGRSITAKAEAKPADKK